MGCVGWFLCPDFYLAGDFFCHLVGEGGGFGEFLFVLSGVLGFWVFDGDGGGDCFFECFLVGVGFSGFAFEVAECFGGGCLGEGFEGGVLVLSALGCVDGVDDGGGWGFVLGGGDGDLVVDCFVFVGFGWGVGELSLEGGDGCEVGGFGEDGVGAAVGGVDGLCGVVVGEGEGHVGGEPGDHFGSLDDFLGVDFVFGCDGGVEGEADVGSGGGGVGVGGFCGGEFLVWVGCEVGVGVEGGGVEGAGAALFELLGVGFVVVVDGDVHALADGVAAEGAFAVGACGVGGGVEVFSGAGCADGGDDAVFVLFGVPVGLESASVVLDFVGVVGVDGEVDVGGVSAGDFVGGVVEDFADGGGVWVVAECAVDVCADVGDFVELGVALGGHCGGCPFLVFVVWLLSLAVVWVCVGGMVVGVSFVCF